MTRPTQGRGATLAALMVSLGLLAAMPAYAQSNLAYVSSEKDDALTMIDLKTLAVTGVIKTCKRPRHMARVADGKQLMVACAESGKADLIDLATRKSVGSVKLGDDPEAFDISPDGKTVYVSMEEDAALGIIDKASGKLTRKVKVGEEPEGVIVSPDGSRVYVTSEVANMVHVIDPAQGTIIKNLSVGNRPRRFAFNASGSELWVSNELGSTVAIVSTKDLDLVHTIKFEVKGMRPDDISRWASRCPRTARRPMWRWVGPTTWPSSTWPRARSRAWCWWASAPGT